MKNILHTESKKFKIQTIISLLKISTIFTLNNENLSRNCYLGQRVDDNRGCDLGSVQEGLIFWIFAYHYYKFDFWIAKS
jgi:hypothetical protein